MPLRYIAGAVLVFLAMAGASLVVYRENQELYYTVDELVAESGLYPEGVAVGRGELAPTLTAPDSDTSFGSETSSGPVVRVRGSVDHDSLVRSEVGLDLRFRLDGDRWSVPVVYRGLVPDTLEEATTVTVRGRVGIDGAFVADELTVPCPSKYQEEAPGASAPVEPEVRRWRGGAPGRRISSSAIASRW